MDKNHERQTKETVAIEAAANEKKIEGKNLMEEIALLLPDYFLAKEIKMTEETLEMRFYNGQIFSLKAQEI